MCNNQHGNHHGATNITHIYDICIYIYGHTCINISPKIESWIEHDCSSESDNRGFGISRSLLATLGSLRRVTAYIPMRPERLLRWVYSPRDDYFEAQREIGLCHRSMNCCWKWCRTQMLSLTVYNRFHFCRGKGSNLGQWVAMGCLVYAWRSSSGLSRPGGATDSSRGV